MDEFNCLGPTKNEQTGVKRFFFQNINATQKPKAWNI